MKTAGKNRINDFDPINEMIICDALGRRGDISKGVAWLMDYGFTQDGFFSFERDFRLFDGDMIFVLTVKIDRGRFNACISDIRGYLMHLAETNLSERKIESIFGSRYCDCEWTEEDFEADSAEGAVRMALLDMIRISDRIKNELKKRKTIDSDYSREEYLIEIGEDEDE